MSFFASIREAQPPWRVEVKWSVCLGAVVTGVLAGALVAALCRIAFRASALALGGVFYIAASVAALLFLFLAKPRGELAAKLGIGKVRLKDVKLALGGLGAVYAFELVTLPLWGGVLRRLGIDYSEKQSLLDLCAGADWQLFMWLLVLVGLVIPAAEELFFRHLLFGALRPLGVFSALFLTAAIFGALHWFIYGMWVLTFFGIVLQWLYLRTGNLATNILAHAVFNAASLCAAFCLGEHR